MTLRTILMQEEAISEYSLNIYDKTASSYMFGAAMSSGFGSGFSGGFKIGKAPNSLTESSGGFDFQYRAGKHEDYGRNHLNIDVISPVDSRTILQKIHIDWKK